MARASRKVDTALSYWLSINWERPFKKMSSWLSELDFKFKLINSTACPYSPKENNKSGDLSFLIIDFCGSTHGS